MKEFVRIDEHLMQANVYGAVVYCTLMGECKVESASIEDNRFRALLVQKRDFKNVSSVMSMADLLAILMRSVVYFHRVTTGIGVRLTQRHAMI